MGVTIAAGFIISYIDDVYADDGPSQNLTAFFENGRKSYVNIISIILFVKG